MRTALSLITMLMLAFVLVLGGCGQKAPETREQPPAEAEVQEAPAEEAPVDTTIVEEEGAGEEMEAVPPEEEQQ